MKNFVLAMTLVAAGVAFISVGLAEEGYDHSTGAKTTPVHRLTLRDENDISILPTADRAWPMSARNTCGGCHNYGKIVGGFHFNAATSKAAGRQGEPWVWVDPGTGTQLPISYRDRVGAWKPGKIGLTAWRFTQVFGRHLPGGGVSEPSDPAAEFDPDARWGVSGKLEANCLGCHSTSHRYSPSEWAKQVGRENFRWAATAASGIGDVGGMATRQPDWWLPTTAPGLDANVFNIPPAVEYDTSLFDKAKHRTFLKVAKPQDKRCLHCHSVTAPGKHKWQVPPDVHSAAGLNCVSCHRNGEDHKIIRGYPGEAAHRKASAIGELSCKGCHLGAKGASGVAALGGRLGAPRPKHAGLPALHMEKLACTACHSGSWPGTELTRVRTSRANRLGIAGRAQWQTASPVIVEPVFVRGKDGKIAPHRMMWPAFWGKLDGQKVTPLLPDDVAAAAKGVLDAPEQIGTIMGLLAPRLIADENSASSPEAAREDKMGGTPVFITAGKIYRRNVDGGLDVAAYTGKTADVSVWWARERSGETLPLIRFEVDSEGKAEPIGDGGLADGRVMEMIKALNAGKLGLGRAVLSTGDKIFERAIVTTEHSPGDVTYDFTLVQVKKGLKWTPGKPHTPTFAWLQADGQIMPLVPESTVTAVVETVGTDKAFTEAQAATVLAKLNSANGGSHVYVSAGRMFSLDGGKLVAGDNPAAEAVSWPLAHGGRPARQALGARGCTDCHSLTAPILTGRVAAVGPMKTDSGSVKAMYELAGLGATDRTLFDKAKYRTYLNVVWRIPGDVHSAAGLNCASCHRNGEGQKTPGGGKVPGTGELSCKGCHLGVEGASGVAALGGRLGAPRPKHAGLPAVHMEKLACTACHSGPWPGAELTVRTSPADPLGIVGGALGQTNSQAIVEPVFLRGEDGKIATHRMMWPAFWGKLDGQKVTPLQPHDVAAAAKGVLDAPDRAFTEAQAATVLARLNSANGGSHVYVSAGRMFSLEGGKLVAGDNPAAEAVSSPLSHDVRPARQALGVRGCTDCHSSTSPFLTGQVAAVGPMKTDKGSVKAMYEFTGLSATYHKLFGLTFTFRTMFKTVLICVACIILAVLSAYGVLAIRRLARYAGTKE